MDRDETEKPLSESSVSLKLALIQQRCRQLANENSIDGLSLEEPIDMPEDSNPYNRG